MITRKDNKSKQVEEKSYPYIGEAKSGCVVLFTKPHIGVTIFSGTTGNKVGTSSDGWAEEQFTRVPELIIESK